MSCCCFNGFIKACSSGSCHSPKTQYLEFYVGPTAATYYCCIQIRRFQSSRNHPVSPPPDEDGPSITWRRHHHSCYPLLRWSQSDRNEWLPLRLVTRMSQQPFNKEGKWSTGNSNLGPGRSIGNSCLAFLSTVLAHHQTFET